MLKSFYDAGNAIDSREYDIVTLAGYTAKDDEWPHIENRWLEAVSAAWATCRMPQQQPFLHTTDMMAGDDPFTRNNGWTIDTTSALLTECVRIIREEHAAKRLWGVSSSVMLKDYAKVRRDVQDLPDVEDICALFCLGSSFDRTVDAGKHFLAFGASVYFDQNDPFYGSVAYRWGNVRYRKQTELWSKIAHVGSVDSKLVPAVQLADLLAWSVAKWHTGIIVDSWQVDLMTKVPHGYQKLTEWSLRNPNEEQLRTFRAIPSPKRSPFR